MCILTFLAIGVTPVAPEFSVAKCKDEFNYKKDKIVPNSRHRREVNYNPRGLSETVFNSSLIAMNETANYNSQRILNETVYNSSSYHYSTDNSGLNRRQTQKDANSNQNITSEINFTFKVTKPKTFDISVEKTTQSYLEFHKNNAVIKDSTKLLNISSTRDDNHIAFDNIEHAKHRRSGVKPKCHGRKYERSNIMKELKGKTHSVRRPFESLEGRDTLEEDVGLEIPDSVYVRDDLLSHYQMKPYIKRTDAEDSSMKDIHKIENKSSDKKNFVEQTTEPKTRTDHHNARNYANDKIKYNDVRQNKEKKKTKRTKKRIRKTTIYIDEDKPTKFFKEITTTVNDFTNYGSRFSVISNQNENNKDSDKKKQTKSSKRLHVSSTVRKPFSSVTLPADSQEIDLRNSKKSRLAALKKKIDDLESKMSQLLRQIKSKYKLILKSASTDLRNQKNNNKHIESDKKTSATYDPHEKEIKRQGFEKEGRPNRDKTGNRQNMTLFELLLDVAKHTILDWRGPLKDEAKINEWMKLVYKHKGERPSYDEVSKIFSNSDSIYNKIKEKYDKRNSLDATEYDKPKKHGKFKKDQDDEIVIVRDGIYEGKYKNNKKRDET